MSVLKDLTGVSILSAAIFRVVRVELDAQCDGDEGARS